MQRRVLIVAPLSLLTAFVLILIATVPSAAKYSSSGGSGAGRWLYVGHGECIRAGSGTLGVCVDWYENDGTVTSNCCIDPGREGSTDFGACTDFRVVHPANAVGQHVGEP